jgi:colicin import membrane protein
LKSHPNNDPRRFPAEKKKGIIGTILIHSVLLLMFIMVAFKPPKTQESGGGGILVNFGTDETGLGMIEPSPPPSRQEASPPPSSEKPSSPVEATTKKSQKNEALLTQNNEEAPAVKKVDPEDEKKRLEKVEAEKKLNEQIEMERKRKELEELDRKRIEAEQKRQSDIMNRTRDALANSKNSGTSSTSEGEAGGKGNQGVPTGSVDTKNRGEGGGSGNGSGYGNGNGTGNGTGNGNQGISYNLGGRGYQVLPPPKYEGQVDGRVVVEVSVDRAGNVVQAIPGTKGSTTLNEDLLKVAKEAALKAKFQVKADAPAVQKGTITYNFILR